MKKTGFGNLDTLVNDPKVYSISTSFGSITPSQAKVLLALFGNNGGAYREKLRESTTVSNSAFSSSVIMPLIRQGYIRRGYTESGGRVKYYILPNGSALVEELNEYSKQAVNPS
ncbi:hypothetical protein A3K73_02090 [Candidatus Pacearchaeota archaeon RBG_13_36_9]|nr:MAG: hypothetical protein A3K73_02090 [Candidatus Pacearchaeota archaeon RBG_13_36_9]